MEFSRQQYWSELPCPSPGSLPNPETEPESPAFQAGSLPLSHQGSLSMAWEIPWTEAPGYSPWGHREIECTDRVQLLLPDRPSAASQPPGPRSELTEPDGRGLSLLVLSAP